MNNAEERIFNILDESYSWERDGSLKFHLSPEEQVELGITNAELDNVASIQSHLLTFLRAKMLRKGWSVRKTDYKFWNKKQIPWEKETIYF